MSCFGGSNVEDTEPRDITFGQTEFADKDEYPGNAIKTSKYEIWNFPVKNLWEQLHRFANTWFLILSALMILGTLRINNTPIFPAVIPPTGTLAGLLPMMAISAILAALDDWSRHRADSAMNKQVSHCVEEGQVEDKVWASIEVGDLLVISDNEELPADIVVLASSGLEGVCYVSTANLDGETNLKIKNAANCTQELFHSQGGDHATLDTATRLIQKVDGSVTAEAPSQDIHNFQGNISLGSERQALDAKNLLLRGTILRNTSWCIGLTVYTGPQTRIMMNSRPVPAKAATLDRYMNVITVILIGVQSIMALISLIGYLVVRPELKKLWYLTPLDEMVLPEPLGQWLAFFLLYSNLVPVSCFATVEACNFVQAYYIDNDEEMYDEKTEVPSKCRATNLAHEVGQVSYIFSDKTGTLTQNIMDLKQLLIGGSIYGKLGGEKGFQGGQEFEQARKGPQAALIDSFIEALATCHTVIVGPSGKYEAESPEESTMVELAANLGYKLKARQGKTMVIERSDGGRAAKPSTYQVLGLNAFNSDRKRMSIVLRRDTGEYLLVMKGADNVMMARATKPDPKLEEQLSECSREGLRCLVIGVKKLSEPEAQNWVREHDQAHASMTDREKRLAAVAEKIEGNVEIIGSTAIEDKLQEDVGETILKIRQASVKLWVLTGDKLETARNIGYSTKVLSDQLHIHKLESVESGTELGTLINHAKQDASAATPRKTALLITGKALNDIKEFGIEETFLELGTLCSVVIACRVSPSQKAEIVSLVRDGDPSHPVCLAIGDGANDVPMIQEAHVGVGIFGREGRQAVNNSDFAVPQFKCLAPLLFVHGRWNYFRVSNVILYSFWRNAVLVISMFLYSIAAGWSGTSVYEDLTRGTFNLVTALPSVCIGIFDRDMDKKDSLSMYRRGHHHHNIGEDEGGILRYSKGRLSEGLNGKKGVETVLSALFHALLLCFNMRLCYPGFEGFDAGDIWSYGTAMFICMIMAVFYRSILIMRRWNWVFFASLAVSLFGFIFFIVLYGLFSTNCIGPFKTCLQMYRVYYHILKTPVFWISFFTVPAIAMSLDVFKQYLTDVVICPHAPDDKPVDAIEIDDESGARPPLKAPQHKEFIHSYPENMPIKHYLDVRDVAAPRLDRSSIDPQLMSPDDGSSPAGYGSDGYAPIKDTSRKLEAKGISKTAFAQQKINSCVNPLFKEPGCCAATSLCVTSVIFFFVGIWGSIECRSATRLRLLYDGEDDRGFFRYFLRSDAHLSVQTSCPVGSPAGSPQCTRSVQVPVDMEPPIYLSYVISPYYQNYYDYYNSVNWKQFLGIDGSGVNGVCSTGTSVTPAGNSVYPCGLQASSFFNDTYEVTGTSIEDGRPIVLDESGIAWDSDYRRFKNPAGWPNPDSTLWLNERFPQVINNQGVHNEHFAVWVRVDSFTEVRKKYGQIKQKLLKGQNLTIKINPNYPINPGIKESKELVLSTLSLFGDSNDAFASFFIFAGVACVLFSMFICAYEWCSKQDGEEEGSSIEDTDDSYE